MIKHLRPLISLDILNNNDIFISALLSHQMEQLLKLKNELSEGRKEVDGIKGDVRQMEQQLKAQEMLLKSAPQKMVVCVQF